MARVVVLLGGLSPERPVSLSSGAGCAAALRRLGHDVIEIDPQNPSWIADLASARPDAVFNALHGEWGEDGRTQGVLEYLKLPYTHSGVLASAIAMDKDKSKAVFAQAGLPLAKGKLMDRHEAAKAHPMPLPYVVKPNAQGSSVGVYIVREGANRPPEQLLDPDWTFGDDVLVEEFIDGQELTVAVMHDRGALAVTEILPAGEWYDFDAKYSEGGSRHEIPAKIPQRVADQLMRAAEAAHHALGCRGVSRSDFRYDPKRDVIALLEVNTQPGMTPTSLVPEQAAYLGMSYDDIVAWILGDASCQR
ncbi:D-alanine--D-alanine ligase [Vitreimonas flagellata]|uniref:D-alanine--D-alanine ligase n=1 Tax=Vitreimonas flagellata TaxID=2560861 RepID=UPI001074A50D|nr:D-alanine--D-alanine ligase [Vitreimonas flagellata]